MVCDLRVTNIFIVADNARPSDMACTGIVGLAEIRIGLRCPLA